MGANRQLIVIIAIVDVDTDNIHNWLFTIGDMPWSAS